jgi:hypothetical protein
MPADPTGPERLDGEARFRAGLVAYLNSLFLHGLALPEPTRVALMHEL